MDSPSKVKSFPPPSFISKADSRAAIAAASVDRQFNGLAKQTMMVSTDGATVNSVWPTASRVATFNTPSNIGILSVMLNSCIACPVAGAAGLILALGSAQQLSVESSIVILAQHIVPGFSGAQPISQISGAASDGTTVETLPSGSSISLYAFGPADAACMIAGGVVMKFATIA